MNELTAKNHELLVLVPPYVMMQSKFIDDLLKGEELIYIFKKRKDILECGYIFHMKSPSRLLVCILQH